MIDKSYRKFMFIVCVNLFFFHTANPQNIVDNVDYRASYLFSYKVELKQEKFAKTDLMFLDIGKTTAKFYSRHEQIRDSVSSSGIENGLFPHEIVENLRNFKKGRKTIVYNFIDENLFHTTEGLIKYFSYKEERILPSWKIGEEKKEIAGYNCQQATANYLGREWIVFFTPEIPINLGPWKLWGLSGLIVEAKDKDNLFSFKLDGFEVMKSESPIFYIKETASGKPHATLRKREFQKMEKLFYKDFLEFTRLFIIEGNGRIHQSEKQKQKYQQIQKEGGVAYIPLEPY